MPALRDRICRDKAALKWVQGRRTLWPDPVSTVMKRTYAAIVEDAMVSLNKHLPKFSPNSSKRGSSCGYDPCAPVLRPCKFYLLPQLQRELNYFGCLGSIVLGGPACKPPPLKHMDPVRLTMTIEIGSTSLALCAMLL